MPKKISHSPPNPQPKSRKKRRGGLKFFLILLIAGAGTTFYYGWVSFQLNEGEYGVVFTKTRGYHKEVLIPGTFSWLPEALLPTNLSLHILKPEIQVFNLKREGNLPSGSVYAETAGINTDFSWAIQAQIVYKIKPEALPNIASNGLPEEGLKSVYASFENKIENSLLRLVAETNTESDTNSTLLTKPVSRLENIKKTLEAVSGKIDDRIIVEEISILQWRFPDFTLYEKAKELTSTFMEQRAEKLSAIKEETLLREDRQNAQIELLKRYGELANEYPKLSEFLPLISENNNITSSPEIGERSQ